MKKARLLNYPLSAYLASLGHGDKTCVADAGLPIPNHVQRIDLALERGVPKLFNVLTVMATEAVFEEAIIASELPSQTIFVQRLKEIFGPIKITILSHDELKRINQKESKAIVRTGENQPFYNVILVSGVKL